MIICPNCNEQLEDGVKFCNNCGTRILETVFCPNCGKQINKGAAFCPDCGATISNPTTNTVDSGNQQFSLPKKKFKPSKKSLSIGSACIAIVLIIAIVLPMFLNSRGKDNYVFYIKDNEIYFSDFSRKAPTQITSNLLDSEIVDDSNILDLGSGVGQYLHICDDKKSLFYIDKMSDDTDGVATINLYYRNIKNLKKDPIKIDSEIDSYSVSKSGDLVTYLKSSNACLYQHNLKDKEKIASDVLRFEISDDGKRILYQNEDGDLYLKCSGEDKEKISSDVSSVPYISDDFKIIYYIKDDILYKKNDGKDSEKIVSDVTSVVKVYESGEIYYIKSKSTTVPLLDYIEDDMKEKDSAMIEPEMSDYPSYDEYWDAKYIWWDKEDRDELREYLSEEEITILTSSLYYYNGKEEKVLTNTLSLDAKESYDDYYDDDDDDDDFYYTDYNYTVAQDSPVIIYSNYDQKNVTKVKLSEIDDTEDAYSQVEEALFSAPFENIISIKDSETIIEQTDACNFTIDPEGETVYFFSDVSDYTEDDGSVYETGNLYKMTISKGKLQKTELYDKDVDMYTSVLQNGKFYYYKNDNELYINKEKIDSDVLWYKVSYGYDVLVYLTDWNSDKSRGTLKMYENGKAVKIADDVSQWDITPNNDIVYLNDYSSKSGKGTLSLYKNGKSKKIDDDVTSIIYSYKLESGYNYGF